MITDFIINSFIQIPYVLLSSLPDFHFEFNSTFFDTLSHFLQIVSYVLPVKGLMPILVSSFGLTFLKISWALVLRVKSFIPTMGS